MNSAIGITSASIAHCTARVWKSALPIPIWLAGRLLGPLGNGSIAYAPAILALFGVGIASLRFGVRGRGGRPAPGRRAHRR
jgi:hypothetical protein